MRRECAEALIPFKGMHRFIPALIRGAGYQLVEIPVNHRPRRFGQTKYGFGSRALRATVDMFGVRWLLSRRLNYKIRGSYEPHALVNVCRTAKLAPPPHAPPSAW